MADLNFTQRRDLRRLAQDAIHACNRHYGPFVDAVARPLDIIALLDMADGFAAAPPVATAAEPASKHHPEEWGPSSARKLTCSCGNPDPAHLERGAEAPKGRIDCRQCNGTGQVRGHLDDCFSALCTLNGDAHSCPGEVQPCPCTKEPLNGIRATMFHDEGAIAQCGYCKRYTLDRKALSDRQPTCTCGKQHGWSGSFVKPGPDAQWHGPAPSNRTPGATTASEFAARYQWLRERPLDTVHKGGVFAGKTPDNVVLNGADLDAAIDAARLGAVPPEGQLDA